jgi:hypothetical protein
MCSVGGAPYRASGIGIDAMKKFFLILIAGFALVVAHDFNRVYAGDHDGDRGDGIPLSKLAGKFATAYQGSITTCFNPKTFPATENCFATGAMPIAANAVFVGQLTHEKDGDSCLTATITLGTPGAPNPPFSEVFHAANKVTNYDPATGSGDQSFTNYTGGKSIESKIDKKGATVQNTGTFHFVASDNGERTDAVGTSLTDSLGDIGASNLAGFYLKQKQ